MKKELNRKVRLDRLIQERGLVQSREKARALILEGRVLVNNKVVDKAGSPVSINSILTITETLPFVSRGGLKLQHAITHFNIDINDVIAMDIGASTGGFTDCLLQNGAKKVYAIDVGYGQFDYSLRNDERVILLEKTNVRHLDPESIRDEIDIATIDVSFISILKVLPRVSILLKNKGEVVALIKPQFETGRKQVGRGGVVKDESVRLQVIETLKSESENMGFTILGVIDSPIKGPKGNVEYLMYMRK